MKTTFTTITKFVIGLSVISLSACHTLEGAGRDIQSAGDAIEDAAK